MFSFQRSAALRPVLVMDSEPAAAMTRFAFENIDLRPSCQKQSRRNGALHHSPLWGCQCTCSQAATALATASARKVADTVSSMITVRAL